MVHKHLRMLRERRMTLKAYLSAQFPRTEKWNLIEFLEGFEKRKLGPYYAPQILLLLSWRLYRAVQGREYSGHTLS